MTTRDRLLLAGAVTLEVLALLGLVLAVITGPDPSTLLPAAIAVVIASVLTALVVIGLVRRRVAAAFTHVAGQMVPPGGRGAGPGYGGPSGHGPSDAHAHHSSWAHHHHDSGGWHDAGWSDAGSSGADWSSSSGDSGSSSDSGGSGSDSGSSGSDSGSSTGGSD